MVGEQAATNRYLAQHADLRLGAPEAGVAIVGHVVFRLHGYATADDEGSLAGQFEVRRVPYCGPVRAGEKNQFFSCCGALWGSFATARMFRAVLVQIIWLVLLCV